MARSGIPSGKVIRTTLRAIAIALPFVGAAFLLPAEATRKLQNFDPISSGKADVLAFKTYGKNLRITASADIVNLSFRGFPDVSFNSRGYAERVMIRTPVRSGSVAADFSLGCGG